MKLLRLTYKARTNELTLNAQMAGEKVMKRMSGQMIKLSTGDLWSLRACLPLNLLIKVVIKINQLNLTLIKVPR